MDYDDDFMAPIAMIQSTRHPREKKEPRTIGDPGTGGIFIIALTTLVYLTGFTFCCGGVTYLYFQNRAGNTVWAAIPNLDPDEEQLKAKATSGSGNKIALTPDVAYSGN